MCMSRVRLGTEVPDVSHFLGIPLDRYKHETAGYHIFNWLGLDIFALGGPKEDRIKALQERGDFIRWVHDDTHRGILVYHPGELEIYGGLVTPRGRFELYEEDEPSRSIERVILQDPYLRTRVEELIEKSDPEEERLSGWRKLRERMQN